MRLSPPSPLPALDGSPSARSGRVAAGVALAAGSLCYLLRPTDPQALGWLPGSLARALGHAREACWASLAPPSWVRGAIPDAAYGFALGAWLADAPPAVLAVGLAVTVAHELLQGAGLASGTFDVLDLAVLVASYAAALLAFRRPSTPATTRMPS